MLLVLAFVFTLRAEVPQNLHVRSTRERVCAKYLDRVTALGRGARTPKRVRAYFRESRIFLRRAMSNPSELARRQALFHHAKEGWESATATWIVGLGLIAEPSPGPWEFDRETLVRLFPHFARFLPVGYRLMYDPFYLLPENTGAEVSDGNFLLPIDLLDPARRDQAEAILAHETVHVKMAGHPLSRHILIEEKLSFPRSLPPTYAESMSTEEIFSVTVDLLNRWRLEARGVRLRDDSAKKERKLRAFLSFYLDTIYPLMRDDSRLGSFVEADVYRFNQAPLVVFLEPSDEKRTLRRDLKAQNERVAEACRDLRARLDTTGDRAALLIEFLEKHGLNPHDYLL